MITPNGGVFGRNPKFNNVTVDGNLTVNGDIALGDDIVVTDTLTVNGITTVANTTDSTTKDNGALVVEGGVGIEKRLNVGGGMTVVPSATVPTSNVAIGPSAGLSLNSAANGCVAIGNRSGDLMTAAVGNIAIGEDALGAMRTGALSITNTTPGTGGTAGTYTLVQLDKDSGTGTFSTYPVVTLTVNAGGAVSAIAITNPGIGATVQSGIVFKVASPVPAGVPSDWRGTLASVTGRCVAVGTNALFHNVSGNGNVAMGFAALQNNTTGTGNIGIGPSAGQGNTTGASNTFIGNGSATLASSGSGNTCVGNVAGQFVGVGGSNTAVGNATLANGGGGSFNTALGAEACNQSGGTSNNTAVGYVAMAIVSSGNDNVAVGYRAGTRNASGVNIAASTDSVFIGSESRANATGETNQIVIGKSAVGDGSNTAVIGNSSITSTRIAGTATSLFRIDGDTMRIAGTRTPASNAAGTAGDFCFGTDAGTTYLYYCIANANWGRVALTTGY
jgi:hypothetical protein